MLGSCCTVQDGLPGVVLGPLLACRATSAPSAKAPTSSRSDWGTWTAAMSRHAAGCCQESMCPYSSMARRQLCGSRVPRAGPGCRRCRAHARSACLAPCLRQLSACCGPTRSSSTQHAGAGACAAA